MKFTRFILFVLIILFSKGIVKGSSLLKTNNKENTTYLFKINKNHSKDFHFSAIEEEEVLINESETFESSEEEEDLDEGYLNTYIVSLFPDSYLKNPFLGKKLYFDHLQNRLKNSHSKIIIILNQNFRI